MCKANNIINGLGDIINGVLTKCSRECIQLVECIGDQVVGAFNESILLVSIKFQKPLVGALDLISNGFDVGGFLGGTASAILGLADKLDVIEVAPEFDLPDEWVIGKGSSDKTGVPVEEIPVVANVSKHLRQIVEGDVANAIQDIAGDIGSLGLFDFYNPSVSAPGFKSALGNCYAGPPELGGCGGTKIKIFGGGKGKGGVANAGPSNC